MAKSIPPSGKQNAKLTDTEIQGDKAGKRNRASTDAGVMPPPAGEAATQGRDPRTPSKDGKNRRS